MKRHPIGYLAGAMAIIAIIAACSADLSGGAFPPAEALLSSDAGPEVRLLRRGRAVAMTQCAQCHRVHYPKEYAPAEWPAITARMARLAGLSGDDGKALAAYLKAASRAERRVANSEP